MTVILSFTLAWGIVRVFVGVKPFTSPAFVYVNTGLFLAMVYYLSCLTLDPPETKQRAYRPKLLSKYSANSPEYYKRRVLEFRTLVDSIAERGQGSVISGTIFVTASLLILGQASQSKPWTNVVLAFASLGIYSLWLFGILYTSKRLDAQTFSRLRYIENLLDIEAITFVGGIARGSRLWKFVRSPVWGIMLLALTFIGFFVLLYS